MKAQLLTFAAAAMLAASCSNGGNEQASTTSTEISACDCVEVYKGEDEASKASCDEKRKTAAFDDEFRKCMAASITGRDPEEVNLIKQDEMKLEVPVDATYMVDAAKSKIVWTGGKITGAKHTGLITAKSGAVSFAGGKIAGGKLVLDMTSITNTDLPEDQKAKLVGHLSSEDFFNVGEHPEAYFEFASAESTGSNAEITGKLSIKGIVKPVVSNVIFSSTGENGAVITGTLVIDRTEWDVKYGSGKFFDDLGDNMINDDITLKFQLKAFK
ncbi:MAG: YceI family protein [Flavobacteriales bacterium]|nr:YceI family protein [Flavobacteriales bacterium]MDG2246450.1 YceI family protein [Flavobacteriales bacterium]